MRITSRLLLFAASCIALALESMAEVPAGYYDGINGLKDRSLKNKLYEIISVHSTNSYSGLFSQSFIHTDVRTDNTWWDMYSNVTRYIYDGGKLSWTGMNREHSFPKSWWGGDENAAYTDLNHLYPSDGPANMAKSNYPLGEVSSASFSNGLVEVGTPVSGQGGGANKVFEPADEYKGDFARTYFYMVTSYQNLTWRYTYMAQNSAYPTLQDWAIDLLLKWHRADPVSDKELNRNDEVYRLQSNRNPFIDYPELVEYIWGNKKGEAYTNSSLPPAGEGIIITPQNNSTVDFGDLVAGNSKTISVPIRGKITDDLSVTISGTNRSDFSIPVRSIGWEQINNGDYTLNVTYAPKAAGSSNATLLLYDGGLEGITSYSINLTGTAHDMPTFDRPEAMEATNVTSTGFRANWKTPANPTTIDYYVVNISQYTNGDRSDFSIETDGNANYLDVTDIDSGSTYVYTVQSSRFGMLSGESNAITVTFGGIHDATSTPLAIEQIPGGVRFLCSEILRNVRIVDMSGRIITTLPEVSNGQCVLLPSGAYLIASDSHPIPVKTMVGY